MAKRRNYQRDIQKAEARLTKLAGTICDRARGLQLFGIDTKSTAASTACEDAEALVALWEAAAADANEILIASMNTATVVLAGLQAAYAVRASVCETA